MQRENRRKERVAKLIARSGLCSRREAEVLISTGRVSIDGFISKQQGISIDMAHHHISVDGRPIPHKECTRVWLYHKPRGLISTTKDPRNRSSIFDCLPARMPRVISVGRLDINSEGLMLLTNDGNLALRLALPSNGLIRRYLVRAFGKIDTYYLNKLSDGITINKIKYRPIKVNVKRQQNGNSWLNVACCEGKNLEVKKVLWFCGLKVNRLIRTAFGPFQLANLERGSVRELKQHVLHKLLRHNLPKSTVLNTNSS